MDDRDVSRFDQSSSFIADNLPPMWRRMYVNLMKEGFGEDQAFQLVKAYVFATAGGKLEK